MLFTSARIYSFNNPVDANFLSILEDRLPSKVFLPCPSSALSSVGWVSPINDGYLTRTVRSSTMICMRIDEKVMPSSVIRSMVDEKAKSIEQAQARKVRKRERDSIRDEIIHEMLPKALIKTTLVHAYIDIEQNIIVVDAASPKTSELLLSLLRATIGSLPVQPFSVSARPTTFMTGWLISGSDPLPKTIELRESCVLVSPVTDNSKVTCKNIDLESDEVKEHLHAGKQVVSLALSFNNSMTFKLESDLSLKSIRFTDEIKEKYGEDVEDEISRFDADLFMQSATIALLVDELEGNYGKAELKEVAA